MSRRRPKWCNIHQHYKWCEHNGGVISANRPGGYGPPIDEIYDRIRAVVANNDDVQGADEGDEGLAWLGWKDYEEPALNVDELTDALHELFTRLFEEMGEQR